MLNLAAVLFPPFISRGFQFALFIALASVSTTMSASHSDFTKSGIDSFTPFYPFLLSLCFYFSCSPFAFPFFHSRVLLFSNFSTAFFSFVRFLSLLFSSFSFFCYCSNPGFCYEIVLQDKLYTPTVKEVKSYFLTVFISEKMLILLLDCGLFMYLGEILYYILLIISHCMVWKNIQNTKDSVLAIAFWGW